MSSSILHDTADITRTILEQALDTFRNTSSSTTPNDAPANNTAQPLDLARTIANIRLQSTKAGLARFSPSINADAHRHASTSATDAAVAGCLRELGALLGLLVAQYLETLTPERQGSELRFAVASLAEQRRRYCVELCIAVAQLVDGVDGRQRETQTRRTKAADAVAVMMESLALDLSDEAKPSGDSEQQEEEVELPDDVKFRTTGIVIEKCKAFEEFEKALSSPSAVPPGLIKKLVHDIKDAALILDDAKLEIDEFIKSPRAMLGDLDDLDDSYFDGSDDSDDDDDDDFTPRAHDDDDDSLDLNLSTEKFYNPDGSPTPRLSRLLTLAKLLSTKTRMFSLLLTSLLKRRIVPAYLSAVLEKQGVAGLARFINTITTNVEKAGATVDILISGVACFEAVPGDDGVEVEQWKEGARELVEVTTEIAVLASESVEDQYCGWFEKWPGAFSAGMP